MSPVMRTGLTLTDAEVRILTTALAGAYPHEVTMEAALDAFWHEDRRVLDGLTMMGRSSISARTIRTPMPPSAALRLWPGGASHSSAARSWRTTWPKPLRKPSGPSPSPSPVSRVGGLGVAGAVPVRGVTS